MCLSNTVEKEKGRFEKLTLKLQTANSARDRRVADAIVSVLNKRFYAAKKVRDTKVSDNYILLFNSMREELIPTLPISTQYKIYYS